MSGILCEHEWTYIQKSKMSKFSGNTFTHHGRIHMKDSVFEFETDGWGTLMMYTSEDPNASYLFSPNGQSNYIDKWIC